jgi:hypothetical protein
MYGIRNAGMHDLVGQFESLRGAELDSGCWDRNFKSSLTQCRVFFFR